MKKGKGYAPNPFIPNIVRIKFIIYKTLKY